MSKFKVGDIVRRTLHSHGEALVGECYIVSAVNGASLDLEGHERVEANRYNYIVKYFELVQAASEQPAVLTPLEVFQCILEGTPLEYSSKKLSGERTWYTITNPKHVDLEDIECADFRKKAQTVQINGIDVPAPAKLPTGTAVYYPDIRRADIQKGYLGTSGMRNYWATEADAQAVLDAILTSFSK